MTKIGLVLVIAMMTMVGCAREIGDDCSNNAECGYEWTCDRSQPGGYCTITPCNDDVCPGGSACVTFGPQVSYCMKICRQDRDCRDEYVCVTNYNETSDGFCNQAPTGTP